MLKILLLPQPARYVHFPEDATSRYLPAHAGAVYAVAEDSAGCLRWGYLTSLYESYSLAIEHPHVGYLAGNDVTPGDAELITGLSYPAAMDRLRELVHESA